ncbi:hypothetical protein O6P43_017114 [Quillaja saponaria]|uniref:Uncharacterized protein n=1 Tax=Quillaja saponaria TaxID=32244 RepID=A0AAD7LP79_QUISA|nr:hypothetical protein O6P43_017114 [Quillaja saponaria]
MVEVIHHQLRGRGGGDSSSLRGHGKGNSSSSRDHGRDNPIASGRRYSKLGASAQDGGDEVGDDRDVVSALSLVRHSRVDASSSSGVQVTCEDLDALILNGDKLPTGEPSVGRTSI